jgi:hypothetical protein
MKVKISVNTENLEYGVVLLKKKRTKNKSGKWFVRVYKK